MKGVSESSRAYREKEKSLPSNLPKSSEDMAQIADNPSAIEAKAACEKR